MKRLSLAVLLISLAGFSGCSSEQYGAAISKNVPRVQVKDVILKPALRDTTVRIEGVISSQCLSSGCWFFLNDGTGQLYIDLAPKGFALPPRGGRRANVTGIVTVRDGAVVLVAEGVELS